MSSEKYEALRLQNKARRKAPGPTRLDLVLSTELEQDALKCAKHLASLGKLVSENNDKKQGQNLYWSSGSSTFVEAVEKWLEQEDNYNGEVVGGDNSDIGSYTQIVWPETTKVGIAKAVDAKGGTYVVARYLPAGNIVGKSAWGGYQEKPKDDANSGGNQPWPGAKYYKAKPKAGDNSKGKGKEREESRAKSRTREDSRRKPRSGKSSKGKSKSACTMS